MKRLLLALAIAAMVFGGVFGLAAGLNTSTKTLGAGTTIVAACQSATLTASYATTYDTTIPGYTVGQVTVSGLASTCYSLAYRVTLVNASNVSLDEQTGTTPASGTTFVPDFTSSNVAAASITGIHITITG